MMNRRPRPTMGPTPIRIDRFVNTMLNGLLGDLAETTTEGAVRPAVDIRDDGSHFIVELDVPGFAATDFDIAVDGDELRVAGERELDVPEGDTTWLRRERTTTRVARTVRLGSDVNVDAIDARLENGVLTITLPKVASTTPRKIEVRTSAS